MCDMSIPLSQHLNHRVVAGMKRKNLFGSQQKRKTGGFPTFHHLISSSSRMDERETGDKNIAQPSRRKRRNFGSSKLGIISEEAKRLKKARTSPQQHDDWYSLANLRMHNPELDTMHGHRACLASGDYTPAQWDDLVNLMISPRWNRGRRSRWKHTILARKVDKRDERPTSSLLRFYTLDWRPSFLGRAVFAGFFPYATDIDMPNRILKERCVLNLELCGTRREATGKMTPEGWLGDPGGRLILSDIKKMRIGKKTIRTVNKHSFTLTYSTCFERVLEEIVKRKGVNWLGFRRIRDLFLSLPRVGANTDDTKSLHGTTQSGAEIRMCTFELWDHKHVMAKKSPGGENNVLSQKKVLAAAEVGFVVGTCYTSLSGFADTQLYRRCDCVQIQASLLWLSQMGIKLFDVGSTASYFQTKFGFRRATRREFVDLWRKGRSETTTQDLNKLHGKILNEHQLKDLLRQARISSNCTQ